MTKQESRIITDLKRNVLFRALPAATLACLAESAVAIDLPRGKRLYRNGARTPGLYTVVNGCLTLNVGTPTADKVIELVAPGGYLGLASTLLDTAESVTAEALADSTLLLIPHAVLIECATNTPQLALQLATALSRQVQGLIADIEASSLHSGRERVAEYVQQLVGNKGARFAGGERPRAITLPAKKSIIASRLNLTPEYFSRVLHDLISAGAIAVNGRQITVLDPVRLHQPDA